MRLFPIFKVIFRGFLRLFSLGGKKTPCKFIGVTISNWVGFPGAPDIIIADNGTMFIGNALRDIWAGRNIKLQTVTPGHHRSLGAPERRHRYFRGIMGAING